jgi:hypothetical protein
MDKIFLLNTLLDILSRELNTLIVQYESTKFDSIDAPHRMESRYDTSGVEAAWLADGLAKRIQEKRKLITQISNFSLDSVKILDKVVPGCIVETSGINSKSKKYYFLLPFSSGGYTLNSDGAEIVVIGIGSPIGRKMLLKQVNDTFTIGEDNIMFKISNIY